MKVSKSKRRKVIRRVETIISKLQSLTELQIDGFEIPHDTENFKQHLVYWLMEQQCK